MILVSFSACGSRVKSGVRTTLLDLKLLELKKSFCRTLKTLFFFSLLYLILRNVIFVGNSCPRQRETADQELGGLTAESV